jgi:hypothetical protein
MMKPNYPGRREFILGIAGSSVGVPAGAAAECWPSLGPPAGVHNGSKLKPGNLVTNVLGFGAVVDGRTLCTAGIQAAIDACAAAGGGKSSFHPESI